MNKNIHFKGANISLALVALLIFTVLLWTWENNPIATTLRSAQEWHRMPSAVEFIPTKFPEIKYNQDVRSPSNEDCNYGKGRWVADSRRPLYSWSGCKQFIAPQWSCRLTRRQDFSFEGYRWQPLNCHMPEFDPSAFLTKMRDQTIAFIGDSLALQQFDSLMCMATSERENLKVQNVGWEYGLIKPPGAIRPDGFAYRFPKTNTTILNYWSDNLCDLVPLNNVSDVAMHLDRPPAFIRKFLHRFDVLVLNTGHHWNRGKFTKNRWVMYVDGKPNEDKMIDEISNAKSKTIYNIVRWLDLQLVLQPRLKVFFRTISPMHYFNGDWETGFGCENTIPLSNGSEVTQEGSMDQTVEGAIKGTKIKILDITALSQLRDEAHVSPPRFGTRTSDCLHWCLPGVPDTWNELLLAQI